MLFDDGLVKVLKGHRMLKANPNSMQSSPLFMPASGTKQDRRDKKRKLNVAALFSKRLKMGSPSEKKRTSPHRRSGHSSSASNSPVPEDEQWLPRFVRKNCVIY